MVARETETRETSETQTGEIKMNEQITSITAYAKAIIDEFNKHAEPLQDRTKLGLHEEGFHAFMCNAISGAVMRSGREEVREHFRVYRIRE